MPLKFTDLYPVRITSTIYSLKFNNKDMDGPFSNQYFGSPMVCERNDGQSDDEFSSHCWKQGTSLIDNTEIGKNAPCLPENQSLPPVRTK